MLARSGLITAHATVTPNGVLVTAPLAFDDDIVVESGTFLVDTQDIGDALGEVYFNHYDDWCLRKSAARAAAVPPRAASRSFTGVHTPCPALWAGR